MNKKEKTEEALKVFDKKLTLWQVIFTICSFILICNLFSLQVLNVKHYRDRAKRIRSAKTTILRGEIVDRNGIKLASDKTTYDVYFNRNIISDKTDAEIAELIAPALGMTRAQILKKLSQPYKIIALSKGIEKSKAMAVRALHLREISTDPNSIRVYPQGSMAAHVLGYYNEKADSKAGVELVADELLDNSSMSVNYQRTAKGDIVYSYSTDPESTTSPLKGSTLTLTIDSAIQHLCEVELAKVIQEKKALRGTIIVMNPKNGEILAYAVSPGYNPNSYAKANYNQIKNWTLTDVFPPGSTFKIITIATALEAGKLNEYSRINDTGKMTVGSWEIKNYDYYKHPNPGSIDLVYLFEHSSNVASAKAALMIPPTQYYSILKRFGYGEKTGIDLPGESRGLLKNPKKWDVSDHASMGYGYASSVTAIQMVSAISAIANGGVRVTPHVIKYSPEVLPEKVKMTQVMSPENARILTRTLAKSVERSKAPIKLEHYTLAAKTGTSRKPLENGAGYSNKLITSVIGYLPASNPRILIYVVVDSASGYEIWGSTVAGPVFHEVATQAAHLLNIPPDKNVAPKI